MTKSLKNSIAVIGTLALFGLTAASAQASVALTNTVSFSQPIFEVSTGDSLTVELTGNNFTLGPDGAAFSLAWDPSVLSYVNTSITNPSWDSSFVNADSAASGLIDYVFLAKSTVGDAGADFALASFTFNVIGNAGDVSSLTLSNDPYNVGFISPGAAPINVNYINSQVEITAVPVPAAAWLFGSGLMGLLGSMRLRKSIAIS
ncbi:MAG: cohesin domain-containing protein [Methylococcaceae bacterium]|nr:cohesin domain-containing protein [Methylococcaceae bacterium]MDP3902763.1 cohesin domain-containing protein [Methylococcaceae bacterium]